MGITRERFAGLMVDFMKRDPVGFVEINGWGMGCPVCHSPALDDKQTACCKCGLRAVPPTVEDGEA
jgi:hypothetical protein